MSKQTKYDCKKNVETSFLLRKGVPHRMKPRITARSGILGAGILFFGFLLTRHFLGLRNLGYMDSAIGTVLTLVDNENKFAASHPEVGFTCNLADVTMKLPITDGKRAGYMFQITDCARSSNGRITNYKITARPLHSDLPAYCANQSGMIKADYNGSVENCVKAGQSL